MQSVKFTEQPPREKEKTGTHRCPLCDGCYNNMNNHLNPQRRGHCSEVDPTRTAGRQTTPEGANAVAAAKPDRREQTPSPPGRSEHFARSPPRYPRAGDPSLADEKLEKGLHTTTYLDLWH